MFMALFPTMNSGVFLGQGGKTPGLPYGFTSIEEAKKAAEALIVTAPQCKAAPILILDLDKLEIVSSVRQAPTTLPWVDRR